MAKEAILVRSADENDRRSLALLFAAVAEEGDRIGAEPPVDVGTLAANWQLDSTLVALGAGEVVGELRVERTYFGYGEIGTMVAAFGMVVAFPCHRRQRDYLRVGAR